MENEMIKKYNEVFADMVQCRIENYNYDLEENQVMQTLTDEEVKEIANRLIYNNDYLWEQINSEIDDEIYNIIAKR